jgi:hypothetical protein
LRDRLTGIGRAKDHEENAADEHSDEDEAAAAGHAIGRWVLMPAGTAAAHAFVGDDESPGAARLIEVIDGRAIAIRTALRVDRDGDAGLFEDRIVLLGLLIEGERILVAAAAAAGDPEPEVCAGWVGAAELAELVGGRRGDLDHAIEPSIRRALISRGGTS